MANELKIILFHADWCGYCQQFKPEWNSCKQYVSKSKHIKTIEYSDVDTIPRELEQIRENGYPTILLVHKDKQTIYNGNRKANDIFKFVYEWLKN